ncbi:hypothetical protein LWI29_006428 [Acer saccharum]|uniref:Uncharacterized protein n=1 Tax=Acer saccharum TaxID=4024 RepID=A0AA39VWZ1_ACESA|nr:hypothetical protein LWI29_006428 [Acer saccharum]
MRASVTGSRNRGMERYMASSSRNPQLSTEAGGNGRSNQIPNVKTYGESNNEFRNQVRRQEVNIRGRNMKVSGEDVPNPKRFEPLNKNNIEGNKMELEKVIIMENSENEERRTKKMQSMEIQPSMETVGLAEEFSVGEALIGDGVDE